MSKVLQNKKIKSIKRASNPTLETIRMVKQTLSKMRNYPSKNRLWRALPKQIQYPTFKAVLDFLRNHVR